MTTDKRKTADDDSLRKLVNASGFVFQLAVESAVESTRDTHGWAEDTSEYPWQIPHGEGYIDLIFRRDNHYLITECKRVRDADWVFLMPDRRQSRRTHARVCWTNTVPHRPPLAEWGDIQIDPGSVESEFCVVRGHGEKDRPLLERLASVVASSVDAVASDLLTLHGQVAATCILVPLIVTTAKLYVCEFDPKTVGLGGGELAEAAFTEVPSVRFRKSLAQASGPLEYEPNSLSDLSDGSVRTVFIVNADHLVTWLRDYSSDRGVPGHFPWDHARARAEAMGRMGG